MSYIVINRFHDIGETEYWAVNDQLGIKRDGSGPWPQGLLLHNAGTSGDGWVVTERWVSKAAADAFMKSTLAAALAAAGMPRPVQMIEYDTVNEKDLA